MDVISVILVIIFCIVAAFFLYGLWLVDNDQSPIEVSYIGESINKAEEDVWIVFPWEEWWKG